MPQPSGILSSVWSATTSQSNLPTDVLAQELLRRLRAASKGVAISSNADLFGVLGIEIESTFDSWENRLSRARMGGTFGHMSRFLDRPLAGATCVELGAGSMNPLGVVFIAVALGAARGIAVDLDPPQDLRVVARALARCASYALLDPRLMCWHTRVTRSEVAQHLADFDLARLYEGDPAGIDQRRLMLLQQSADRLSLGDSEVDFLISTSFLEHVADVPAVLAEMHRVMKPGALMVHSIDGADHRQYADASLHPLEFLLVDSDERILFECNRLRPLEFTALYAAAGFDIVSLDIHDRVDLDEAFLRRLAPRFRNLPLEQLQTLRATIHARKR